MMGAGRPRGRASRGRRAPRPAVGVISLGCPKNLVDTEVMLGLLGEAGCALVANPGDADVILVNTCSFIAAAREESARALEEAIEWKKEGTVKAVVCAGCWPRHELTALHARYPEVDAFMGPGDVPRVVSVVEAALAGKGRERLLSPEPAYLYDDATPRLRATPPWTAYVKIAEGCSHGCAFCVIPRLRGPSRCRPMASVVSEARALADQGVIEVNVVAQDATAYRDPETGEDIADLLGALAHIPGLRWIRLLYAFPTGVTSRLIEVMAEEPTICKYLDLPFQHADREVLRGMGRPGDGEQYLRLIAELRQAMPDIAIRSTFLVGFPGESERAFGQLLAFVEAAQLDRVGAFTFSAEEGTRAAEMPDQVPPEEARERYHRLMSRQQTISLARNQRWVGRTLEVLTERPGAERGEWVGRSFRDAPEIDGTVVIASRRALRPGDLATVKVSGAEPYDLFGTSVD